MDNPRGILIAIGGGEDKERHMKVLKRFVDETDRRDPYIEVITTATNLPVEVGQDYSEAFKSLDVRNFGVLHIDEREQANDKEILDRLNKADGVLFSGGDQLKLSTILGGTEFHNILKDKYLKDRFVIAGTSAGAAAMSNTMIVSGTSEDSLIKGHLQLTTGLSLIYDVIIDTHFTQRGRFGRLIHTVATNPSIMGLGLGEDTGAIIKDGKDIEVIGSGLVILIDGTQIKYTNLPDIKDGDPISVDNVILHVLSSGERFDLKEKNFIRRNQERK